MQYKQEDGAESPYPQLAKAQTPEYLVYEALVHGLEELDADEQLAQEYPILLEFHSLPFSLQLLLLKQVR